MNQERPSADAEEIERRWQVICDGEWEKFHLDFEYVPKGENEWNNLPADDRLPIRGTLVSIQQFEEKAVIRTRECYRYRAFDSRHFPHEDVTIELSWRGILPKTHGDMMFLTQDTARLIVFGVACLFKD